MARRWTLPSLKDDARGGISMILAGSLFMLAGAATVSVDLGSVYLAKRQLQGMADAAALAAIGGGRAAAQGLIDQGGASGVSIASMETGTYAANAATPVGQRFQAVGMGAAGTGAPALRIELRRRAPLFFGRLLVGRDGVDLAARATAAKADAAAFSLGTSLASVSGGVPNVLLSALAGVDLNLSVMDYQGLASANVDILDVADALRLRLGRDGEPYGALFDRDIPLSALLTAMADAAAGNPAAATLLSLANRIPGRTVRLSDVIDLGPSRSATNQAGQTNVVVDAFSMLRMALSPPSGVATPIDMRVTVPGLTSTRVMLITGEGQARSPLMTITASRDVVLRTAQTRLYVESSVATLLGGLGALRIPIYVELAAAEARLSAIDCAPGGGVTLAVTPSIGSAILADVDTNALTRFSTPANPRPALLAQLPGTQVTAFTQMALGGTSAQAVSFTADDIASKRTKTVSTGDVAQGLAASLADRTSVQVSVLGVKLGGSPLSAIVGGLLGTTAPIIDDLLNGVTAALGVRLGAADVRVHDRRCGIATIVA